MAKHRGFSRPVVIGRGDGLGLFPAIAEPFLRAACYFGAKWNGVAIINGDEIALASNLELIGRTIAKEKLRAFLGH